MEEFVIETLQDLVEAVKVASPALWQIARRQVWAALAELVAWLMFSAAALWASVRWYLWLDAAEEKPRGFYPHDNIEGKIFAVLAALCAAIAVTALAGFAVKIVVNPDYYAIREIAGLLK